MSETLTLETTDTHRPHETTVQGENLQNQMWGIEPTANPAVPAADPTVVVDPGKSDPKPADPVVVDPKVDTPAFDESKYVKEKFGWDSADAGKQELETLRERAKALDLTNDESRKMLLYIKEGKRKELYEFLHQQEQVDRLLTSDLSNKDIATELVKFGISKNKNLTKDEVNFLFNERFSIPEKPVKELTEVDDDYNARIETWQKQVENIQTRLVIEAKLAQPELEKLKVQIDLPDIQTQVQQPQLTQEALDAAKKYDEAYTSSVTESLKNFNGFSVKVKNEAVGLPEISIPYATTDADKTLLNQELMAFANANYNTNSLFKSWLNEDKSINTKQVAEDRYLLANRDKIFQKLTEEAASKAIDAYVKGKKNININETNVQQTAVINKEDKTEMDTVRDQFFS